MRRGCIVPIALAVCSCADGGYDCQWVRWPSPELLAEEWVELSSDDIYEVLASRELEAVSGSLQSEPFVPLTADEAEHFNDRYEAAAGKQPYLVRATYGHSGVYSVLQRGRGIQVRHSSLGHTSLCHPSALVVNLDFVPEEIFVEVSIAE